ncbi:hypothetical protein [Mycoplasma ovis]|nr:hypothetical protein [Mycoplasma ovis]
MNFFSQMVLVFQENSVAKTVAPCLIGVGALVLVLITYSQFQQVRKTSNTIALDKKFMFFQIYACFFLGSASVYGLCGKWDNTWGPIDIALVMINICLFCTNFYTLRVKIINSESAKKAGMTEAEYYEKVIVPTLTSQVN